jgi:hypothetical protein
VKIYGASDDLVEIEDCDAVDEIGCYDRMVRLLVGKPDAGLYVVMQYAGGRVPGGVWHATIAQVGDGIPIPWPVRIDVTQRGYSVEVSVDCPKDTPVAIETADADCDAKLEWSRTTEDLRRQALAKLTPEEIEALGIET